MLARRCTECWPGMLCTKYTSISGSLDRRKFATMLCLRRIRAAWSMLENRDAAYNHRSPVRLRPGRESWAGRCRKNPCRVWRVDELMVRARKRNDEQLPLPGDLEPFPCARAAILLAEGTCARLRKRPFIGPANFKPSGLRLRPHISTTPARQLPPSLPPQTTPRPQRRPPFAPALRFIVLCASSCVFKQSNI